MRMLAWAASALALVPSGLLAQSTPKISAPAGYAPMQAPCVAQTDGSCVSIAAGTPLPTSDANSAAYIFGVTMTSGATYPLATNAQRGFYAICTAAGTATLTDTSGTIVTAFPLSVGIQYHPIRLASFSALTGTCSIGLLK